MLAIIDTPAAAAAVARVANPGDQEIDDRIRFGD